MKNQTLRIVAALFVFAGLLFSIACSPPPTPPANQANVQPSNGANAVANSTADRNNPCDDEAMPAQEKADALNARIKQRFMDDPKFRQQYEEIYGRKPLFKTWVVNNKGVIELLIKGRVNGKDNNGNSKLEGILDIIDGYLDKAKCIQKVRLIPGEIMGPNEPPPLSVMGFEWILCDSGQVACSGGRCMPDPPGCGGFTGNENIPSNTNSNTNANGGRSNTATANVKKP